MAGQAYLTQNSADTVPLVKENNFSWLSDLGKNRQFLRLISLKKIFQIEQMLAGEQSQTICHNRMKIF
jgi:hypothetical protein